MQRLPVRRPAGRRAYVQNRSSRGGVKPKLLVIHTTESHDRPGRADVDSIREWFNNPASQASSHVIIDADGHSTTCVPDKDKAWTQAKYNSLSLSIELIGWAKTPRWQWLKRRRQIKKAAKFLAYWSKTHKIPLERGRVSNGSVVHAGVVGHMDLGQLGGGHHDPGPGFPMDKLLSAARYYLKEGWPHE